MAGHKTLAVLIIFGCAAPGAAQPLPTFPAKFETKAIPGGVLKVHNELGDTENTVQDVTLSVNGHALRAYWTFRNGFDPGTPAPPTLFADGRSLIVGESSLPNLEAVLTGGGRTYVRVTEGGDDIHFPNLWIIDVSQAKILVTRRIKGCEPLKQVVIDGAYVLTCKVNGEHRTVTHEFKDGVLK